MRRDLPLAAVYRLIEPGPVVLLTTIRRGRPNVMAMSWHMMMEFEPPLIGCIVSNRNYSFDTLRTTRECVINVPRAQLIRQVVACGNASGRTVDKFAANRLTPVPASLVRPPLIAECHANLECRVADTRFVNRYNFFVLEVVKAWIDRRHKAPRTIHHQGMGQFMIAGRTMKLASRAK